MYNSVSYLLYPSIFSAEYVRQTVSRPSSSCNPVTRCWHAFLCLLLPRCLSVIVEILWLFDLRFPEIVNIFTAHITYVRFCRKRTRDFQNINNNVFIVTWCISTHFILFYIIVRNTGRQKSRQEFKKETYENFVICTYIFLIVSINERNTPNFIQASRKQKPVRLV